MASSVPPLHPFLDTFLSIFTWASLKHILSFLVLSGSVQLQHWRINKSFKISISLLNFYDWVGFFWEGKTILMNTNDLCRWKHTEMRMLDLKVVVLLCTTWILEGESKILKSLLSLEWEKKKKNMITSSETPQFHMRLVLSHFPINSLVLSTKVLFEKSFILF